MNKLMLGFRASRFVRRGVSAGLAALVVLGMALVPATAGAATTWRVGAGAETPDQGIQLAYYFSNNLTVNAGDTITWKFQTGEPHSIHFLSTGSGGEVDSGLQIKGAPSFSLTFNMPGDYAYFCDLHNFMKGVVHVQSAGSAYPHDQKYYNRQSEKQQDKLFAEGRRLRAEGLAAAAPGRGDEHGDERGDDAGKNVTAGIGAAHPNDGGSVFVLRFLNANKHIKVGDTVTWTNRDPEAPHTITFNPTNATWPCPGAPFMSLCPVGLDSTGLPGHATIPSSTPLLVNSGFTWAAPAPFVPPPLQVGTVFKATFTKPGTYQYYCDLHDDLGMVGTITVSP